MLMSIRGEGASWSSCVDALARRMATVRLMEHHPRAFARWERNFARADYLDWQEIVQRTFPEMWGTPVKAAETRSKIIRRSKDLDFQVLDHWLHPRRSRKFYEESRRMVNSVKTETFNQLCRDQAAHLEECADCDGPTGRHCAVVQNQIKEMAVLIATFTDDEYCVVFGRNRR